MHSAKRFNARKGNLCPRKLGFTFFSKSRHTLFLVGGGKSQAKDFRLIGSPGFEIRIQALVDGCFTQLHGYRRSRLDRLRHGPGGRHQFFGFISPVYRFYML